MWVCVFLCLNECTRVTILCSLDIVSAYVCVILHAVVEVLCDVFIGFFYVEFLVGQ